MLSHIHKSNPPLLKSLFSGSSIKTSKSEMCVGSNLMDLALANTQCQTGEIPSEIDQTLKKLLTWTALSLESAQMARQIVIHIITVGYENDIACHVNDEDKLVEGSQGNFLAAFFYQDPVCLSNTGIRHLFVKVTEWVEWVSLSIAPLLLLMPPPAQFNIPLELPSSVGNRLPSSHRAIMTATNHLLKLQWTSSFSHTHSSVCSILTNMFVIWISGIKMGSKDISMFFTYP